ncbi:FAD dependent oxidoreductase-like protein superfamily [Mollisia scopiformis]|uniref:FAD dependent oxidoreductase-like protein superfamily n=1 Tax=Mollisia scopiformis TaxID=149040 RepID=A0A132BBT9_MOLSC|nr:FAD dependent oxidoreductase-like protein superfamily [Mollisia scopiformis]KUJ09838.1 FAD dependent oxidoreductase-like protein superfamily [Mollisia scopiformis]
MATSKTVILGTGIIGLSTAYYLSDSISPSSIHLVDPSPELFASASGRAAGFLAKDWFSSPLAALGALSFEEHKRLAEKENGRENWGYMRSTGVSYTPGLTGGRRTKRERGEDWLRQDASRADAANESVSELLAGNEEEAGPRWLSRSEGDAMELIGEQGTTAQVDPLRLCQFLLKSCLDRGVQLHHPARAISVGKDMRDELSSIRILNTDTQAVTDIPCTKILISAGAWSPQVFSALFPDSRTGLPISSLAGHSIVVRSQKWSKEHEEQGCHAVFTTDSSGYSPEIFSRMGEEIYIAGLNSSVIPLPKLATESELNQRSIDTLKKTAERLLGADGFEVVREGLCFRPVTNRGTPVLSRIEDAKLGNISTRGNEGGGVWLAAGHGPWGITNSLGTGKVMSEMIMRKKTSVDISGLGL